eukprot:3935331-Amphidinium_carterae.1
MKPRLRDETSIPVVILQAMTASVHLLLPPSLLNNNMVSKFWTAVAKASNSDKNSWQLPAESPLKRYNNTSKRTDSWSRLLRGETKTN